jgi:translation initiation factor IF-3
LIPSSIKVRVNEGIRASQIRLIGVKGEQLGIVDIREGLRLAREEGLDLVEVSPMSKPPVCRILDYGKYLYAQDKKEKAARKKHKTIDIKEVKLTSKIEEHDYQTKLGHARRFLEKGNKVKLSLYFRGREITHLDRGEKMIKRFTQDLADWGGIEKNAGLEGKTIQVYIAPNTNKKGGTHKHAETENEQGSQEAV